MFRNLPPVHAIDGGGRWKFRYFAQRARYGTPAPQTDAPTAHSMRHAHVTELRAQRLRHSGYKKAPSEEGAFPMLPDSHVTRASITRGFPHYPYPDLPMTLRPVVNRCANSRGRVPDAHRAGQRSGMKFPLGFKAAGAGVGARGRLTMGSRRAPL